jgi:hypothetical protein
MRARLAASQLAKNSTCSRERPRLSISHRVAASDVPPVGGFIGSLVLGEMGRDQKETEQNAIVQFLDVHTFQHGLSSQCYALAEDPIADFGLDQVRGSKREWPCEEQGGRSWSLS